MKGERLKRGAAVWCGVWLALWTACEAKTEGGTAKTAEATAGPPASSAGGQSVTSTTTTGNTHPDSNTANTARALPTYDGREGAVQLGVEFRQAAVEGRLKGWLAPRATFPFDVDGKVKVNNIQELDEAMARDVGDVATQVKPHTTCAAISREELIAGGSPWHYLDRLGKRPPPKELEQDLDRLALRPSEWWVNCHQEGAAGYTLIVAPMDGQSSARIRAFRN